MKQPRPPKFVNAFGAKWSFIRLGFNVAKIADINLADKIVLSIIISMSTLQRPFNGGYNYLAYRTAFEVKKIQAIVRKLQKLEYIKKVIKDNRLLIYPKVSKDKDFIPVFDLLLTPPEGTERPPLLDIVLFSWVLAYDFSKQDFTKGTKATAELLAMSVNSVQSAIKRIVQSNKVTKKQLGNSFILRPSKKTQLELGLLELTLPNKMSVTNEQWEEILAIYNQQQSQFRGTNYRHKGTWKADIDRRKKHQQNSDQHQQNMNGYQQNRNHDQQNNNHNQQNNDHNQQNRNLIPTK